MKAMLLEMISDLASESQPLQLTDFPIPQPGHGEVLLKVSACGVCHTELDEIEGRTPPPHFPVIPGHQVIGHVTALGENVTGIKLGDRLGVGWIFSACGVCAHCQAGLENLCTQFRATGRDAHGGYAEYICAPAAFCLPIPDDISDIQAAPLLCAGAIGYRSLNLTGLKDGQTLGLLGFGASGHLTIKLCATLYPRSKVFVFSRSRSEREFALSLGAAWAGDFGDIPGIPLDALIDTTPAWKPILTGLACLKPAGRLVINAIRKEVTDQHLLTSLDYPKHLWLEKEVKSVANVTRADIRSFLQLSAQASILPEVQVYPLQDANLALRDLYERRIKGAKVLQID